VVLANYPRLLHAIKIVVMRISSTSVAPVLALASAGTRVLQKS